MIVPLGASWDEGCSMMMWCWFESDDIDVKGRRIAAVVEGVGKKHKQVVGRFFGRGIAYVVPRQEIRAGLIHQDGYGGSLHGQYVVAEITHQPTVRTKPVGKVGKFWEIILPREWKLRWAIRSHDIPPLLEPRFIGGNKRAFGKCE